MARFFALNKKKEKEKDNTDLPANTEENATGSPSTHLSGNEELLDPKYGDIPTANVTGDDASTTFDSSIQSSSIFSRSRLTSGTGASSSIATSGIRSHSSGTVSYTHLDVYKRQHILYILYSSTVNKTNNYQHFFSLFRVPSGCRKGAFFFFLFQLG